MVTIRTEKLLSTASVAARLNLSTPRILQLVAAGRLKSYSVETGSRAAQHIFRVEDVEALARARKADGLL